MLGGARGLACVANPVIHGGECGGRGGVFLMGKSAMDLVGFAAMPDVDLLVLFPGGVAVGDLVEAVVNPAVMGEFAAGSLGEEVPVVLPLIHGEVAEGLVGLVATCGTAFVDGFVDVAGYGLCSVS